MVVIEIDILFRAMRFSSLEEKDPTIDRGPLYTIANSRIERKIIQWSADWIISRSNVPCDSTTDYPKDIWFPDTVGHGNPAGMMRLLLQQVLDLNSRNCRQP